MDDGRCTMMDVSSSAAIFLGNKISLVFPKSGSFLSFQLSRDPIFARSNTTGLCEGSISNKQTTTTTQHTQSRQNLERQSSSFHHYLHCTYYYYIAYCTLLPMICTIICYRRYGMVWYHTIPFCSLSALYIFLQQYYCIGLTRSALLYFLKQDPPYYIF